MGKNRLELRRMAEAAEKQKKDTGATDGKKTPKKRKAATKKRKTAARKTKVRAHQRKRMVWCVFNGSMKEEGRFPYDQRKDAEKKLDLLAQKSKKPFFIQPVKEVISDGPVKGKAKAEEVEEAEADDKSEEE
jgi:hypothetical protein